MRLEGGCFVKKFVVGLIAGLILGSAGTAIGSAVNSWHESGPGYVCQNNVASAGIDYGPTCDTTKRDWAGGRLQVFVTNSGVGISYDQAKRGGTIYFCKKGLVPIGYHPGAAALHAGYWDGCH